MNAINKAEYYHPKTGQLLYHRYMEPTDDGYKKGMQGAFDAVNDKLICRSYDNISLSIKKRGFVCIIHASYTNNEGKHIETNLPEIYRIQRELKLTYIVEDIRLVKKDYYDFTEENKKKKELTDKILSQFEDVVFTKSKTKTREFMKLIHEQSRKGVSIEELINMTK
jgi:hypothetical protein